MTQHIFMPLKHVRLMNHLCETEGFERIRHNGTWKKKPLNIWGHSQTYIKHTNKKYERWLMSKVFWTINCILSTWLSLCIIFLSS